MMTDGGLGRFRKAWWWAAIIAVVWIGLLSASCWLIVWSVGRDIVWAGGVVVVGLAAVFSGFAMDYYIVKGVMLRLRQERMVAWFPEDVVVTLGAQAGYRRLLSRVGVPRGLYRATSVLVANNDGMALWFGLRRPRPLLVIRRSEIRSVAIGLGTVAGFREIHAILVTVPMQGKEFTIPLYVVALTALQWPYSAQKLTPIVLELQRRWGDVVYPPQRTVIGRSQ